MPRRRQTIHRLALEGAEVKVTAKCIGGYMINTAAAQDEGYERRSLPTQHVGRNGQTRTELFEKLGSAWSGSHSCIPSQARW